jgi:asparagine synthase (glutamine-hydrolysing)
MARLEHLTRMCGIAGAFFVRDQALVDRFAASAIELLAHRGPDDAGIARFPEGAFVHRRLSILDPTPAGHQPFQSADGEITLVYNGEIYNYLELREKLRGLGEPFLTDTDTEVLVASYRRWGADAVTRFNGIWAFALWDRGAGRLLLSRDRLGVKPLYHTRVDGGIAFASEIKALLPIMPAVRPNLGALRDYAWSGLVDHADATFYDGIEPLSPGTNLLLDRNGPTAQRYWAMPASATEGDPRPAPGDAQLVDEFGRLFRSAVGLQLRSDVPLGSCLSGGLDSAAIVTMSSRLVAERLGPHGTAPRIALTASFPRSPDDETERAALVAAAAGIAHRRVTLELPDLLETLDMVLAEQDEPFASASILAQRRVMEVASAGGIKVMLDGQGADELLAGYPHYRYAWLLGLVRRHPAAVPGGLRDLRRNGVRPIVALRQAFLDQLRLGPSGRAPLGREAHPQTWIGPSLHGASSLPLRGWNDRQPAGTPLARHLRRAVVATSLPALLRYEDRNSMRFGVEARVPFLDHRLIEAAARLPDRLRIDHGVTKVVLRRAVQGLVPDEIRLDTRKIGFAVPQVAWMVASMPAIRAAFADSSAIAGGMLDRKGVEALLVRPLEPDGGAELWRALCVERWVRRLV